MRGHCDDLKWYPGLVLFIFLILPILVIGLMISEVVQLCYWGMIAILRKKDT